MKHIEAMKLALRGLEEWSWGHDPRGADVYITALREALSESALDKLAETERELGLDYMQPAQNEPVFECPRCGHGCPKAHKPLTGEEIEFIYADTGYNDIQMFARAIEAAHGIGENNG